MDHRLIEEMNIPELYATGRLSTDDEEAFETHLLECRDCREQVAWSDDLAASVRLVAVEAVEEAGRAAARVGFLAWLAHRSHAIRLGMAAALIALAALPAWLLVEQSRLRSDLAEARRIVAERAEPPAPQVAPAAAPAGPDAATRAELDRLAQERNRLEGELRQERKARESLADRVAALARPQIPALYSLGIVRGASDAGEVEIGPSPEWMVLSLELPAAEHEAYRATLYDAGGHQVGQWNRLLPTSSDTLNVMLYSDTLHPGDYRMSLEGIDDGNAVALEPIQFHVRKG